MKVLRPHDGFQIVLPVHTKTIKATENALNCSVPQVGIVRTLCYISFPLIFFLTKRQHEKLRNSLCPRHMLCSNNIVIETNRRIPDPPRAIW